MPTKQTDMPLDFSGDDIANLKDRGGARGAQRRSARATGHNPGRYTGRNESTPHGQSRRWQRAMVRTLLAQLGNPAVSVRLWDGYRIDPEPAEEPAQGAVRKGAVSKSDNAAVGTVTITSPAVLGELIKRGDVGFGDEFSTGGVLIDGALVDVLSELEMARRHARSRGRPGAVSHALELAPKMLTRKPLANSLSGSKNNIGHHYNIGNEFYRLWLDQEAMQYTCAYYPAHGMSLEQAQIAKLDHVCRKLELKPGDTVFEAGCGWGGLARHMASRYNVQVKAWNISSEQVRYARDRAREMGLENQIEYVEDDYRNMSGSCDKFVSVGMLEHVGKDNFPELGNVIDRCLSEHGRGMIHSIGRNRPRLMNPWIEKRIFPGAYPPSLGEMMSIFEEPGFSVVDVENLRLHYAQTLQHWLERFDDHEAEVRDMFDSQFYRAWRLYLAGSIAAFRTSSLQLFQVTFARGTDNTVPFNREHLYPGA